MGFKTQPLSEEQFVVCLHWCIFCRKSTLSLSKHLFIEILCHLNSIFQLDTWLCMERPVFLVFLLRFFLINLNHKTKNVLNSLLVHSLPNVQNNIVSLVMTSRTLFWDLKKLEKLLNSFLDRLAIFGKTFLGKDWSYINNYVCKLYSVNKYSLMFN